MLSSSVFFGEKRKRVRPKTSNKREEKRKRFLLPVRNPFFVDVVVVVCLLSRSRTSGSNLLLEIVFGENLGDILNGDNRPWEISLSLSSSSSKCVVVRVVVNVVCVRFSSSIFCTHDFLVNSLSRYVYINHHHDR